MRGRSRIPFDRHPLAMLLGAFAVVGLLAAIVVLGPGGVFHFLVSFLLPMAVIVRAPQGCCPGFLDHWHSSSLLCKDFRGHNTRG